MSPPHPPPTEFRPPEESSRYSCFWVEERVLDDFVSYLTERGVTTHPARKLREPKTKLLEVEVGSDMSLERGRDLSKRFNVSYGYSR